MENLAVQPLSVSCESPRDDESIPGFISRLAAANDADQVAWIPEAADLRFQQIYFTDEEIGRLAQLSTTDAEKLRYLAPTVPQKKPWGDYVFMLCGNTLPIECLPRQSERRVCPKCLETSRYHRLHWNLSFVQACSEHRVELLTSCPECKRKLDWRVKDISRCRCGHDLTEVVQPEIQEKHVTGQRYLENMLLGKPQAIPPLLTSLSFDEVMMVVSAWSQLPMQIREMLLPGPADPAGRERFGEFLGPLIVGGKDPDPTIGLRFSLGLEIVKQDPDFLETALIAAAADDSFWVDPGLKQITSYLHSRTLFTEGRGHAIGKLARAVMASRGIVAPPVIRH